MRTRNIFLKLLSLILIIVFISGCSTGQKTNGQPVKPTPGHYAGDPEVSFEITEDGQIQHFSIHMYFDNGNCGLEFKEDKFFVVNEDGSFVIMGEQPKLDSKPLPAATIFGKFVDATTVKGKFSSSFNCGDEPLSSSEGGTWSAKLSEGGIATSGHYEGDSGVTFYVTTDGLIQDFDMHVSFGMTSCNIKQKKDETIKIENDGSFVISGEKPKTADEQLSVNTIIGRFDNPTTVSGEYANAFICADNMIMSSNSGIWSANLSDSDYTSGEGSDGPQEPTFAGVTETSQSMSTPIPDMTQEMLIHEYTTSAWILSQAYSPDGKTIAVGLIGGSIDLLDVESGEIKQTLKDLGGDVTCMVFSPDGSLLAIGGSDRRVQFLSTADWKVNETIYFVSAYSLDFSPDGKYIAAGTDDGNVKVWQVAGQNPLHAFSVGLATVDIPNVVESVKFSPDGSLLAAGSYADNIQVWNLSDDSLVHQFKTENPNSYGTFYKITFLENGTTLAALHGGSDQDVYFWRMEDGSLEKQLYVGNPFDIAFSPDEKRIVASNPYDPVNVFDIKTGNVVESVIQDAPRYVIFSPTGDTFSSFASILSVNSVRVWKVVSP